MEPSIRPTAAADPPTREELRELIVASLQSQGYEIATPRLVPPKNLDKNSIRALHAPAVEHRRADAARNLARYEPQLLEHIASGDEVHPRRVRPALVEVSRNSEEERLFRYVTQHWSIPVSSGYGRRLRFLVVDLSNEKLIGVIGLGDPVINLGVRDSWIGWTTERKRQRLHHVMDAFVIGAVPPYSQLLCGKLVAMLVSSSEVQQAFQRKYGGRKSLIGQRELDGTLALITTSSALGRSSIYNRLSYNRRCLFRSIGFTQGYGEFHFANGLYEPIWSYAQENCTPTERNENWGSGFRNRREVVRKVLMDVGLTTELVYHGVQREVFAVALVNDPCAFLRGERVHAASTTVTVRSLSSHFRHRWLLPRSERRPEYRNFDRETYRLWPEGGRSGNS